MKVQAIALNTFREAYRNKILYSVILFAIVLVGVAALFGAVSVGSQVKVIKDFGLFSLSFCGALITIITGVSLLNKEIKQKTVYNILSKPVERWQFILGKHLGLTATVCVLVALMGIGLILFAGIFEGQLDLKLFQGILFAIMEITIVSSVVMFFSSVVVTTTLTGLFTLATYVAGRSITYLKFFLVQDKDYNPSLAAVIKVFDIILPDLSLFNISDSIVYGNSVSFSHFLGALLYCLAYSAVCLVLATLIFQRRELV